MLLSPEERDERSCVYWTYVEPGPRGEEYQTLSEAEILDEYFEAWSTRMRNIGKADLISHDGCISDWVVINWAWRVTE